MEPRFGKVRRVLLNLTPDGNHWEKSCKEAATWRPGILYEEESVTGSQPSLQYVQHAIAIIRSGILSLPRCGDSKTPR